MIKLIAFLGNYGKQYSGTRHNAAWIFAESLGNYSSLNWQKKFKGQFATESTGVYCDYKNNIYVNFITNDLSNVAIRVNGVIVSKDLFECLNSSTGQHKLHQT